MWAKAAQNSFQKACRIMLCNLHKSLPRAHRICTSQNLWIMNRLQSLPRASDVYANNELNAFERACEVLGEPFLD
jgi:hypothetical protein